MVSDKLKNGMIFFTVGILFASFAGTVYSESRQYVPFAPDINFSEKILIASSKQPKTLQKNSHIKKVQLEKLCSIEEGHLFYSKTPLDLSFEKSGRGLLLLNDRRAAVFRAPDCKILSRYSEADFANNVVSKDGSGLFSKDRGYGSEYTDKGIGTFGLETKEGEVIELIPPKNFNEKNAEFPKLSADGSAVLWQLVEKKKGGHRYDLKFSYLIQDKNGKRLKGPSIWKRGTPYMFDMEQKIYMIYARDGLNLLNWEGEILDGPLKIPGVSLGYSHNPPIKFPTGNLKNWVAWETGLVEMMAPEGPYVLWRTEAGNGRFDFGKGSRINNVSVSGDGLYIGVAHLARAGFFTRDVDFKITLISTATGKPVYKKILATGQESGMVSHRVLFLKDDFIAINTIVGETWPKTDSVNLYKIEPKY